MRKTRFPSHRASRLARSSGSEHHSGRPRATLSRSGRRLFRPLYTSLARHNRRHPNPLSPNGSARSWKSAGAETVSQQTKHSPGARRGKTGEPSGGGASRLEATPGPVLGKSSPEDARPDTPRLSALSTPGYEPLGAGAELQSPRKDDRSKEGVALHADREVLDMRPAGGDLLDGRSRL